MGSSHSIDYESFSSEHVIASELPEVRDKLEDMMVKCEQARAVAMDATGLTEQEVRKIKLSDCFVTIMLSGNAVKTAELMYGNYPGVNIEPTSYCVETMDFSGCGGSDTGELRSMKDALDISFGEKFKA